MIFGSIWKQTLALGRTIVTKPPTLKQALGRMACYLGYRGTRQLLEDMLISLVSSWMSVDLQLTDFPVRLMGYGSAKEFLR